MVDELVMALQRDEGVKHSIAAKSELKPPPALVAYQSENIRKKSYDLEKIRKKSYDRSEGGKEGNNTPSSEYVSNRKSLSEHFRFEEAQEKENKIKLGANITPTVKAGLSRLADTLGKTEADTILLALFALDANPELANSEAVIARVRAHAEIAKKRGGYHGSGSKAAPRAGRA